MSLRSYFSCSGYSFSISTWKYSFGCLVYICDLVLCFLVGGESGEGGGGGLVVRMMIGDGVISAVCGLR